jgi:hypothetical protein
MNPSRDPDAALLKASMSRPLKISSSGYNERSVIEKVMVHRG